MRDPSPAAHAQLRGPRAVALAWRAQQMVAHQPVVGDLPDLVAVKRGDLEAASEVLADVADRAQRKLQPGGRGRDGRRNAELDGQLRETKLDAVPAGAAEKTPDGCRRGRNGLAKRRREERADEVRSQELPAQHDRRRVTGSLRLRQVRIERPGEPRVAGAGVVATCVEAEEAESD